MSQKVGHAPATRVPRWRGRPPPAYLQRPGPSDAPQDAPSLGAPLRRSRWSHPGRRAAHGLRYSRIGVGLAAAFLLVPHVLAAQGFLEQFSYEGLRLTGIGVEIGLAGSDRVTTEPSVAVRVDYGLIAPQVRVLLGGSYFRGDLEADEIAEFEQRLRAVVDDPTGDATVQVGSIRWTNVEIDVDLQYLFPAGRRLMTYLGLGLAAHIRDGSGVAIDDTFVEDALDTITAGLSASFGAEVSVVPRVHVTVDFRGEFTSELRIATARAGLMYRFASPGLR